MALQGIWWWSYEGQSAIAMKEMMHSKNALYCAGNAFPTTVLLAAFVASLCSCSSWFTVAQRRRLVNPAQPLCDAVDEDSQSLRRAAKRRGISSSDLSSACRRRSSCVQPPKGDAEEIENGNQSDNDDDDGLTVALGNEVLAFTAFLDEQEAREVAKQAAAAAAEPQHNSPASKKSADPEIAANHGEQAAASTVEPQQNFQQARTAQIPKLQPTMQTKLQLPQLSHSYGRDYKQAGPP